MDSSLIDYRRSVHQKYLLQKSSTSDSNVSRKDNIVRITSDIKMYVARSLPTQCVQDQIICDHPKHARCLQCCGRQLVTNPRAIEHFSTFRALYSGVDIRHSKEISSSSKSALIKNDIDEKSLAYGEIEFWSFARILEIVDPKPGERFYDLGSGTGKAVIAAALLHDFKSCVGIELVRPLHDVAIGRQRALLTEKCNDLGNLTSDIRFCCGDFLSESTIPEGSRQWWQDGGVVFIASTCLSDSIMDSIDGRARELSKGARVITLTHALKSAKNGSVFRIIEQRKYRMSWGNVTVFIHEKL
eukprot:298588_1